MKVIVESIFGTITQRSQNFGTDFNRRLIALHSLNGQHAFGAGAFWLRKLVGQFFGMRYVRQAAAHESLDRGQCIFWILRGIGHSFLANLTALSGQITNHRWQDHLAFVIGQTFGYAIAHRCYQGVCGAKIDAYGNAPLMRVWCLTRF